MRALRGGFHIHRHNALRGGDPKLLLAPEPVFLLPKPLPIRAGFDVVEALKF